MNILEIIRSSSSNVLTQLDRFQISADSERIEYHPLPLTALALMTLATQENSLLWKDFIEKVKVQSADDATQRTRLQKIAYLYLKKTLPADLAPLPYPRSINESLNTNLIASLKRTPFEKDYIQLLLDLGGNPNTQVTLGQDGYTGATQQGSLLSWAIWHDNSDFIKMLFKYPELNTNSYIHLDNSSFQDPSVGKPLEWAVKNNQDELVDLLIQHPNTDINMKSKWNQKTKIAAVSVITLLHLAVKELDTDRIALLLKHPKINPNLSSQFGDSPLKTAAVDLGDAMITKMLLKHKDTDLNQVNRSGDPLLYSIIGTSLTISSLFLKHPKTDPNFRNINGRTPLHKAVIYPYFRGLEALLRQPQIKLDVVDNNGRSPLHYLARLGYAKNLAPLLEKDPTLDLEKKDHWGKTPLKLALEKHWDSRRDKDKTRTITAFLEAGAHLDLEVLKFAFHENINTLPILIKTYISQNSAFFLSEAVGLSAVGMSLYMSLSSELEEANEG